jgi:negative regulator of sigma-B (phosphoserine phosphatase)
LKLSFHHVSLPKDGERVSGDAVIVREHEGTYLLAVIDALGHGPVASVVADRARAFLESASLTRDVRYLTDGLHDALRGTRGAAGMCCLLRKGRIEGCGIGNVELRTTKDRVPVVLTPGILGVSTLRSRIFEGSVTSGARLLLFSDGISPRMDLERFAHLSTEIACKSLVERYRRAHDDATLLVVDIQAMEIGPGPAAGNNL